MGKTTVETKRPRVETGAADAEEPPPPLSQPHGDAGVLGTIFLDDVPLLDSPAWSSDDELDNPTYNKRFRHKKHEEIRQRLLQRRLEERERQLQLAKTLARSPTPSQPPPQRQHEEEEGEAAAAPAQSDPRSRPQRPPSGGSSHAASQLTALERTKTGRSRRSRRSNAANRTHRRRDRSASADDVVGAGEPVSEAAPAGDLSRGATDAADSRPEAVVVMPRAAERQSPAAAKEVAASVAVPAVSVAPAPPPAAVAAAAAVVVRASTPGKAAVSAVRPEHLSSSSPVSASQTQTPTTLSSAATPSHRGSPQQEREGPTRASPASRAAYSTVNDSKSLSRDAAQAEVKSQQPAAVTPVAFSSTEVHLPKPRGAHTPSSNFFVSKMTKSTSSATSKRGTPAPARSTAPSAVVPSAPPREAADEASAGVAAAVSEARVMPDPPSPWRNIFKGRHATSLPKELDTTQPFTEAEHADERAQGRRKGVPAATFVMTAEEVEFMRHVGPPATPELMERAPHASRDTAEVAEVRSHVPPLSPPQSSMEPLTARRRGANDDAARSSVTPAVRPVSGVDRRSRSISSSVVSGGGAGDRQLRQSDYYNLSGMPSCFNGMLGEAGDASVAAVVRRSRVSDGSSYTALAPAVRASTTMARRREEGAFFSSAESYLGSENAYDYESYEGDDDGEEEEEEEEEEEGEGEDTGRWRDTLSPVSAGSDVDYILAYHSSYYGDLLRHMESPPSPEALSIVEDAERPSETDTEPRSALPEEHVRGRRPASSVHFHVGTDGTSTKSTSKDSPQSGRSSVNSLDPMHRLLFHSGDTQSAAATPPMYSFYTHFQEAYEDDETPSLLASHVNFVKDPYALGVEDSAVALPTLGRAAEAKPSNGQQGTGRRKEAPAADEADQWEYHRAKKESLSSLSKPSAGPSNARKKSSSMLSARYSLLSSRKGMQATKEANAPRAAPPQGAATVRVLSLQGPMQSAAAQPPTTGVKPLQLENFGSHIVNDSKSFDLVSPMTRKTTAPPEVLALTEEGEGRDAASQGQSVEQQQQPEGPVQKQQTLFSFAGLGFQPPAALLAKQKAANTAAAIMNGGGAPPAKGKDERKLDQTTAAAATAAPSKALSDRSTTNTTTATQKTKPIGLTERKEPTRDDAARGPPNAAGVADSVDPAAGTLLGNCNEDAQSMVSHDVYLPVPEAAGVRRFRSLIGSAYLTDVYTSSLRLLTSRPRPPSRFASFAPAASTNSDDGDNAGDDIGSGRAAGGPHDGGASATIPSCPRRSAALETSSGRPAPLPPHSPILQVGAAAAASTRHSLPRLDPRHLATASMEASISSRTTTTTTTTTTGHAPTHRYRRRHFTARHDALVEDEGQLAAPPPPVRVAGHFSGRDLEPHASLPYAAPTRQSSGGGGADTSTSLPSAQASRLSAWDSAGSRVGAAPPSQSHTVSPRSGGSFLRMVAGPASPAPTPSAMQRVGVTTSNDVKGKGSSSTRATPPVSVGIDVAPMSVNALVRRLEANMGTRPPLSVQPSAMRGLPMPKIGAANATRGVAAATPGDRETVMRPNVLSSTQRPVSSQLSDSRNIIGANVELNGRAGSGDASTLNHALPRSLAGFPKRTAASLAPPTARDAPFIDSAPSLAPHAAVPDHLRNSNNASHVNHAAVEREAPKSPAPPAVSPPRLTREALMRQQLQHQQAMILRDQRAAPLPPHLQPMATAAPHASPPQRQGRGGAAAVGCHTTEDLLTRITVLEDARGWRGDDPESSIVSTLNANPTAASPNAGSPTASSGAHRRAASASPNGTATPYVNGRLTASDGALDQVNPPQHHRDGERVYKPLQMTHFFSDEAVPVNTKTAARHRAFGGPTD